MLTQHNQNQQSEFQNTLSLTESLTQTWMIGMEHINAAKQVPTQWQSFLAERTLPEQRLALLILTSQYRTFALHTQKPTDFEPREEIPILGLPTISEHLRPLFNRAFEQSVVNSGNNAKHLLHLLESRGVVVHPQDWLPTKNSDGIPDIYLPWQKWLNKHASAKDQDNLTADSWDDYFPAERLSLLRKLRIDYPDKARDLIAQCAVKESAEKRLKLIQCLSVNLQQTDAEYLTSLQVDRSKKVSTLAFQLLSRLSDQVSVNEQDKDDLTKWYDIKSTGLLKRRKKLTPVKLKNDKQSAMRTELLARYSISQIAHVFNMDSEELLTAWAYNDNRWQDNLNFIESASATLPDALVVLLVNTLIEVLQEDRHFIHFLTPVLPRLSHANQSDLLISLLQNDKLMLGFSDCLQIVNQPIATLSTSILLRSKAWKELLKALHEELKENTYIDSNNCLAEIRALGVLLPLKTATDALKALLDNNMINADPVLDSLKLNTLLTPIYD